MFVSPPSSIAFNRQKACGTMRLLLAGGAMMMAACNSVGPRSEIVVSVKEQKLGLYHDGELKKTYTISTSKFGIGDQPGSYRTPLGKHEVIAKIGHGLPTGAVLKSRHWNGEVLKPNAPGRDPIVSRILWLRGMESANRNAMKRFIYIHGTTEEGNLGKPASFGCIRMGMHDVVDLFNGVGIGAKVEITPSRLPHGHKNEVPKPGTENQPVIAASKSQESSNAPAKSEAKPEASVGPEAPRPEKPSAPQLTAVQPETVDKTPGARREGRKFWPFSKPRADDQLVDTASPAPSNIATPTESPALTKPEQPEPSKVAAVEPDTTEQAQEPKTGGWKFWPFSRSRTADAIDVTDTVVINPSATPQADVTGPTKAEKPAEAPIAKSKSKKGGAYKLEKITTSNRRDTAQARHLHG